MKFKQACSEVVSDIKTVVKTFKLKKFILWILIALTSVASFVNFWCALVMIPVYWMTENYTHLRFGEDTWILSPLFFITFLVMWFITSVLLKMEKNL